MIRIETLRCRVKTAGRAPSSNAHTAAKPAAPSLEFALPEPLAPKPRIDGATDDAHGDIADVAKSLGKVDPQKVADRVYELMQRDTVDARSRGASRRR